MIDDAMLAEWEELQRDDLCDHRACERLETALGEAIAEIRRLREQYHLYYEDSMVMMEQRDAAYAEGDTLKTDLATHQAVVRELAEVLYLVATYCNCSQPLHQGEHDVGCAQFWNMVQEAQKALAHPLVQQAREVL